MGGLWSYLRREVESIREMHPLVSDVQDLGSFVLRFSTWNKHAIQHLLPMYDCQLVFEVYLEAICKTTAPELRKLLLGLASQEGS